MLQDMPGFGGGGVAESVSEVTPVWTDRWRM